MRTAGCALLAVVVAGAAMTTLLRSADWNPRVLAHVDSRSRLYVAASALDPGFRGVHSAGYDGQFYWGIAVDPLALGSVHRYFDKPSYRYGHPLYGWLGWLVSGGQATAAPVALVAAGLGSLALAAGLAVVLSIAYGGLGWEGLIVALNVGLIVAAMNDLAEPLAAALLLAALVSLRAGWRAVAWCCLALLPLAKEPLLIVVAAVVVWELLRGHRRSAAVFATATIPALLWWIYARMRFGAWFTSGTSALGLPFVGWGQSLLSGRSEAHVSTLHHGLSVAALIALIVVFAIGAARALRLRSREDLAYLGLAALAACLALNATASFTTALRNVSFLVILLPFVLGRRKRDEGESLPARKPIDAETIAEWKRHAPDSLAE
jgi:hypothetical protein